MNQNYIKASNISALDLRFQRSHVPSLHKLHTSLSCCQRSLAAPKAVLIDFDRLAKERRTNTSILYPFESLAKSQPENRRESLESWNPRGNSTPSHTVTQPPPDSQRHATVGTPGDSLTWCAVDVSCAGEKVMRWRRVRSLAPRRLHVNTPGTTHSAATE